MKTTWMVVAFVSLIVPSLFAQNGCRQLVVSPHCSGGVSVHCNPGLNCPVIACVLPQCDVPLCQTCEKVDACGTVWAKIEVKGWVQVRKGNKRILRRLMTRDRAWEVMPCRGPVCVSSDKSACASTVATLQPCTVVHKMCNGLPHCGCICACFSGWVVKQDKRGKYFCDASRLRR